MDDAAMLTIGQLADRTGLPVRTIRYWSDIGAVPPAARVGRDHRRYDAAGTGRADPNPPAAPGGADRGGAEETRH